MKLSNEQCKTIISYIENDKANVRSCAEVCHPSGLHKSILDYNISQINRSENTQWFFNLISDFLKKEYPNNTISNAQFFYGHEFFTGAKFSKHIDKNRQSDWALVVGGILNNEFEGGKLLTYNPDGELATEVGEIYVMDSKILHEVTEVTSGVRYSFVFFIEHKYLDSKLDII